MKTLERALSAQAELIASLRRRIDMLERKPPPTSGPTWPAPAHLQVAPQGTMFGPVRCDAPAYTTP